MTDDDFLERAKRRFNRLCSAIVLVRRDRSGQLQRETIGLVPNVPAEHKQFKTVVEILRLFDKMRWCEMLGADIPLYMGMRLAALAVQMAVLDDDVEAIEWFRRHLKLPPTADLTKLHVRENPKDWRIWHALAETLFTSNWLGAKHGNEFAYLSTATCNIVQKRLNEIEGEHIRALKAGYRLAPVSALSALEEVEDLEATLRRAQRQHAVLARAPLSVRELINHAADYPELKEYLELRAAGWTREAIAERPGWNWRQVKRVKKQKQRLLRRIAEQGAGLPCRLLRPMGAISDANYTSVEERFYTGRSAWKHVNSEGWKRP
jgi:hypothetical protein